MKFIINSKNDKIMRKGDVLAWGMQHIASNHGFNADVDYEQDGSMSIYGGINVPTIMDVRMMCEDLGISMENVQNSVYGITVTIDWNWSQEGGLLQEEYKPTGYEMWTRPGVKIGE